MVRCKVNKERGSRYGKRRPLGLSAQRPSAATRLHIGLYIPIQQQHATHIVGEESLMQAAAALSVFEVEMMKVLWGHFGTGSTALAPPGPQADPVRRHEVAVGSAGRLPRFADDANDLQGKAASRCASEG